MTGYVVGRYCKEVLLDGVFSGVLMLADLHCSISSASL